MRGLLMFLARGVLIGLVFSAARMAAVIGFARSPDPEIDVFAIETVAGSVVGLWLQFIVTRLDGRNARRAIVAGTLLFVNLLAVMIEGAAFQPSAEPLSGLPVEVLIQLVVASLVAVAAVRLVPSSRSSELRQTLPRRSPIAWLSRYLACVAVYVVAYFIAGAINFTLITGPYYTSRTAGLVVPPADVVLSVAAIEGALLPVALLPLLYGLPVSRRQRALIGGASLFVLGGVVPLIVAPELPAFLRIASAVEILLQKFPTGAATAALLGPEG